MELEQLCDMLTHLAQHTPLPGTPGPASPSRTSCRRATNPGSRSSSAIPRPYQAGQGHFTYTWSAQTISSYILAGRSWSLRRANRHLWGSSSGRLTRHDRSSAAFPHVLPLGGLCCHFAGKSFWPNTLRCVPDIDNTLNHLVGIQEGKETDSFARVRNLGPSQD